MLHRRFIYPEPYVFGVATFFLPRIRVCMDFRSFVSIGIFFWRVICIIAVTVFSEYLSKDVSHGSRDCLHDMYTKYRRGTDVG